MGHSFEARDDLKVWLQHKGVEKFTVKFLDALLDLFQSLEKEDS